jgi:hypothetical protein
MFSGFAAGAVITNTPPRLTHEYSAEPTDIPYVVGSTASLAAKSMSPVRMTTCSVKQHAGDEDRDRARGGIKDSGRDRPRDRGNNCMDRSRDAIAATRRAAQQVVIPSRRAEIVHALIDQHIPQFCIPARTNKSLYMMACKMSGVIKSTIQRRRHLLPTSRFDSS